MSINILIYADPEMDTYSVQVVGSDNWDMMEDLTEQEAIDEADAIQADFEVAGLIVPIVYV